MMHATRAERVLELLDCSVVSEYALDLSRCRETFEAVGLGGRGAMALRHVAHGLKRLRTTSHTSSATIASGWLASITTQRSGSSSAMSRNALRTRSCSMRSW